MVKEIQKLINLSALLFVITLSLPFLMKLGPELFREKSEVVPFNPEKGKAIVVDGIEVESGLIYDEGYLLVKQNCANCHSLELVTQNNASRAGWEENIRWMQETQGLWDLGSSEGSILDYLSKNYGPKKSGRRANLKNIEWYDYKK